MIEDTSAVDRPVAASRSVTRRVLLTAAAALVLLVAVVVVPSVSRWLTADRSVSLARVRLGTVVRGDLERDVSVQGRVIAAFHPTTSSPANGIVALEVRAGELVEQGQVLAVVASPELNSRLAQERSTLLSLESDLARQRIQERQTNLTNRQAVDLAAVELQAAQRAMRRAELTKAEGILNEVEYERVQDDLRRAELTLAHARETAALEQDTLAFETRNSELVASRQRLVVAELQRQVDELSIRAPVAGHVSRLDVEDHQAVTTGQPLVAVVDLSAFEVEILIPETYAREIGLGSPAIVRHAGREFAGTVRSISPEVEGSQVRGLVAFSEATPEGLRQNQRLSTRIILESRTGVLKAPRGPFLESGGGHQAYVVDGDTAVLTPIRVGAASVEEIEIRSGLDEGDRIIVSETARFEGAERIYLRE
jgi:HlyD family secretion protein